MEVLRPRPGSRSSTPVEFSTYSEVNSQKTAAPSWRLQALTKLRVPLTKPGQDQHTGRAGEDDGLLSSTTEREVIVVHSETTIASTSASSVASESKKNDPQKTPSLHSNHASLTDSSSTPTSTTSVDKPAVKVFEIEKGLFATLDISMDSTHQEAWKKIRPRLCNVIDNTFKPKRGLDPSYSIEFCMAGRSALELRPTVVMVCCNDPNRKRLRKIIEKQKWMADFPYRCLVLVDKLLPLAFGSVPVGKIKTRAVPPPGRPLTLCGAKGEASLPGTNATVLFTVGGVVSLDGVAYGLTVRHLFDCESATAKSDISEESDEFDSSDDEGNGATASGSDSHFIDFSRESSLTFLDLSIGSEFNNHQVVPLHRPQDRGPRATDADPAWIDIGEFDFGLGVAGSGDQRMQNPRSDWSLIRLSEHGRKFQSNEFKLPGNGRAMRLSGVDSFSGGPSDVWINSGYSGLVEGKISSVPTTLKLGQVALEVWQISLSQHLGKCVPTTTYSPPPLGLPNKLE
jgi:hypothetical protein